MGRAFPSGTASTRVFPGGTSQARSFPRRLSPSREERVLRNAPLLPTDPRSLSVPLIGWARADIGATLNGSNVSAWLDLVGGTNWAQATADDQPPFASSGLGSRAEIQFDGSSDTMTGLNLYGSLTTKDEWTVILVTRGWSFGSGGNPWAAEGLFGAPSGGGSYFNIGIVRQSPEGCFGYHVYEVSADAMRITGSGATSLAAGSNAMIVCVSDGSNGFTRVNGLTGAVVTDMAALEASATTVNIGKGTRDASKVPGYYDGTLSEVLVFNGALGSSEIGLVERYLSIRYGIAA